MEKKQIYAPRFITLFKQNWKSSLSFRLASSCLLIFAFLALFAKLLANDKPIYCTYQGESYYPVFEERVFINDAWQSSELLAWKEIELSFAIWPLIKYGTKAPNEHKEFSPFQTQITQPFNKKGEKLSIRNRHWLGTSQHGQDILATLIHGARRSLGIALFTIFIIAIIGITMGSIAGYFQDTKFRLTQGKLFLMIPGIILGWFYGFEIRAQRFSEVGSDIQSLILQFSLSLCIFFAVIFLCLQFSRLFPKNAFFRKPVALKIDTIISRTMEVIQSLPGLLLIITISAFLDTKNVWFVMIIIAMVSWIGIARVVRTEMLSVTQRQYIQAAQALGIPNIRIILRHVIPNSLSAVWPILAFNIGGIIIVESMLSYLALIDNVEASWGGMIAIGKAKRELWWIALFPGICIFLTVYSFNILGESLRDILDTRSQ